MQAEREDCVCVARMGGAAARAHHYYGVVGVVGERRVVVKPMARLPVSLRTGLLACLPKFHTATRTPPDDTAQRARLRQITHLHARLPVCLRGGQLACVPSTHACSHATRVARRHVYCFSIWMINAAALLLNRSMARIHCWSNAHGSNK